LTSFPLDTWTIAVTDHDTQDDGRLIDYLLGRLDADARDQIEARYVADHDAHDDLQAVERDLIDRYVHGELTAADAAAFEQAYLSSPSRRRKVEFARHLKQSLSGAAPTKSTAISTAAARRTEVPRSSSRVIWQWGVAAALVMAVAGAWFLSRPGGSPPSELASAPPPAAESLPPVSPEPSTPALTPPAETPVPPSPAAVAPRLLTLMLLPTATRGVDETPTLVMAAERDVELQLVMETADGYPRYRVDVRTADGEDVWSQEGLTARASPEGDSLFVRPPASQLSANDYTVTASGVTPAGQREVVARYTFRVRR
jgi:hypothetical protein